MEQMITLTEKHHAILFALLARRVIHQFGQEAGQAAMREAVCRYGEQRGRRMAQRAVRDHQSLTMSTYLRYGEWRSLTGEGKSKSEQQGENLLNQIQECPWNNAWLEEDLQEYGRLYCLEIDAALARGFNPEAWLEVRDTLSNNGEACVFVFHQAVISIDKAPEEQTTMPWGYHCAHLYYTCQEVLKHIFGEAGRQAAEKALTEFHNRYGNMALEEIQCHARTDFESIVLF
jgi:hypothetical protein